MALNTLKNSIRSRRGAHANRCPVLSIRRRARAGPHASGWLHPNEQERPKLLAGVVRAGNRCCPNEAMIRRPSPIRNRRVYSRPSNCRRRRAWSRLRKWLWTSNSFPSLHLAVALPAPRRRRWCRAGLPPARPPGLRSRRSRSGALGRRLHAGVAAAGAPARAVEVVPSLHVVGANRHAPVSRKHHHRRREAPDSKVFFTKRSPLFDRSMQSKESIVADLKAFHARF